MCFDTDSSPPIPVISGAAVSHDDLVLEAADGNRFAAFAATPDEPGTTGIVILPDVRGLYRFYEELALRFAERGLSGRSPSTTSGGRRASRSATTTSTTCRTCSRRRRRASRPTSPQPSRYLRANGATSIFTVGFCFGGPPLLVRRCRRATVSPGRRLLRPAGRAQRRPGPDPRAAEIAAPILALQAGDDANITRRGQRCLRRGARGGRRRARGRHLRRRAAQLLRPQAGAVRSTHRTMRGGGCSRSSSAIRLIGRGGRTVRRHPLGREERLVDLPVEDGTSCSTQNRRTSSRVDAVLGRDLLGCEVVRHRPGAYARFVCRLGARLVGPRRTVPGAVVVDGPRLARGAQRASQTASSALPAASTPTRDFDREAPRGTGTAPDFRYTPAARGGVAQLVRALHS